MSFKVNCLLKTYLPHSVTNWFPLLMGPGDMLIYEGFRLDNFPRFFDDTRFSIGYKSKLTCEGWSFGRVKDGETECTINPFNEIHYALSGDLIDNRTFRPYRTNNDQPNLKLFTGAEDNKYKDELNLPSEADLRKELGYFDLDAIEARDKAFESLKESLFTNYRPDYNFREEDYNGTYEDESGTLRTTRTMIYVAESILLSRVYGKYFWSIGKETERLPVQARERQDVTTASNIKFKYEGHKDKRHAHAA